MLQLLRAQVEWSREHHGVGCGDVMVHPVLGYRSTLLSELRAEDVTELVNRVLVWCVVDQGCVDRLLDGVALGLDRHDCFWIGELAVFEDNN